VTIDPGIVVAVIGALATAVGTFGRMIYLDLRNDRDYWRNLALELAGVNKTAIEVNEKLAKRRA
jgi:hypothetical protein